MRYYKIDNGIVSIIYDDNDRRFPNFTVKQRVPASVFAELTPIADDENIQIGMYRNENGEWDYYVPTVEENPNQPIDETISEEHKTYADKLAELEEENASLKEQITSLEDCILEIADVIYA